MNSHITVWHETMSPAFSKLHLGNLPSNAILHNFTQPDAGDAHDHPFNINITVLMGSYVERVWQKNGEHRDIHRQFGTSFITDAYKIHKIISLPDGPCMTIATYGPKLQEAGFWRWEDGKAFRRDWNGDWAEVEV